MSILSEFAPRLDGKDNGVRSPKPQAVLGSRECHKPLSRQQHQRPVEFDLPLPNSSNNTSFGSVPLLFALK